MGGAYFRLSRARGTYHSHQGLQRGARHGNRCRSHMSQCSKHASSDCKDGRVWLNLRGHAEVGMDVGIEKRPRLPIRASAVHKATGLTGRRRMAFFKNTSDGNLSLYRIYLVVKRARVAMGPAIPGLALYAIGTGGVGVWSECS